MTTVAKAFEQGDVETTVDVISSGRISLIVNTPLGQQARADQAAMYAAAVRHSVPFTTTLSAAQAAVNGIRMLKEKELEVRSLQRHYLVQ